MLDQIQNNGREHEDRRKAGGLGALNGVTGVKAVMESRAAGRDLRSHRFKNSRIAVTRCTGVEVGAVFAGQRWGRDRLMNGHADQRG